MIAQTSQNPWTPYDAQAKGKPKPVVPEAPFYGAIFAGTALLFWVIRKIRK